MTILSSLVSSIVLQSSYKNNNNHHNHHSHPNHSHHHSKKYPQQQNRFYLWLGFWIVLSLPFVYQGYQLHTKTNQLLYLSTTTTSKTVVQQQSGEHNDDNAPQPTIKQQTQQRQQQLLQQQQSKDRISKIEMGNESNLDDSLISSSTPLSSKQQQQQQQQQNFLPLFPIQIHHPYPIHTTRTLHEEIVSKLMENDSNTNNDTKITGTINNKNNKNMLQSSSPLMEKYHYRHAPIMMTSLSSSLSSSNHNGSSHYDSNNHVHSNKNSTIPPTTTLSIPSSSTVLSLSSPVKIRIVLFQSPYRRRTQTNSIVFRKGPTSAIGDEMLNIVMNGFDTSPYFELLQDGSTTTTTTMSSSSSSSSSSVLLSSKGTRKLSTTTLTTVNNETTTTTTNNNSTNSTNNNNNDNNNNYENYMQQLRMAQSTVFVSGNEGEEELKILFREETTIKTTINDTTTTKNNNDDDHSNNNNDNTIVWVIDMRRMMTQQKDTTIPEQTLLLVQKLNQINPTFVQQHLHIVFMDYRDKVYSLCNRDQNLGQNTLQQLHELLSSSSPEQPQNSTISNSTLSLSSSPKLRVIQQQVVKKRNWVDSIDFTIPGYIVSYPEVFPCWEYPILHVPYTVRTEYAQAIQEQYIDYLPTTLSSTMSTPCDTIRPIDVAHFWKINPNHRRGKLRDAVNRILVQPQWKQSIVKQKTKNMMIRQYEYYNIINNNNNTNNTSNNNDINTTTITNNNINNTIMIPLNIHADVVSHGGGTGRIQLQYDYLQMLLQCKIIIVAQRDQWEDHYRFFEAIISGALVFTDPMLSLPEGYEHGTNIIIYHDLQELQEYLIYYLGLDIIVKKRNSISNNNNDNNDSDNLQLQQQLQQRGQERLDIARRGWELAMSQHLTKHWMEKLFFGQILSK